MRKSILVLLGSVSIILCEQVSVDTSGSDSSGDGSVASPFRTIQFAIEHNNTSNGDIILVGPGTYTENINFRGKDITVGSLTLTTGDKSYVSETIIDGGSPTNADSASVVSFVSGETSSAKLVGFTIQNGSGTKGSSYKYGGGIYTNNSSPSLKHLVINNNANSSGVTFLYGAGIYFNASDAILDSSLISNNGETNVGYGGGIYIGNNTVDSITLVNVNGLPTGISLSCNSSNCSYEADTVGCADIFGTTNLIGQHPISFDINGWIHINFLGINIPFDLFINNLGHF